MKYFFVLFCCKCVNPAFKNSDNSCIYHNFEKHLRIVDRIFDLQVCFCHVIPNFENICLVGGLKNSNSELLTEYKYEELTNFKNSKN